MKWRILLGTLCFLLIGSRAYAEEAYIVKFNDSIQLFENTNRNRNYCTATYDELCEYLKAGIVEYYEPDCEIELFEDYSNQDNAPLWNIEAIAADKAWKIGCYGNSVKVAVIDSGIYEHPDLKNNILTGYNYIDKSSDTTDNIGHGTYVAGIIATECNESYTTGVAHKAEIVPLKCFDNGTITTASMIADAIYDAIDVYGCDVINTSFGMSETSTNRTLQLSVAYAIQNGCIVVAAVGNDGRTVEYYPAKYDGVIGVGSIDKENNLSWFSQHNATVDVVAPGSGIDSVSIDGYNNNSGTSFAAPHVAGVAAIAKCIDKSITAEEFMELIEQTSTDMGAVGYDVYYGYGLINTEAIIDKMLSGVSAFISPVTDGMVKIYNNSEDIISAVGICANYTDNQFIGAKLYDLELLPKDLKTVSVMSAGEITKITLWYGVENLIPLCPAKEYKLN